MILETIHSPADVKRLTEKQTELLCLELRQFLVEQVSRTGGHLASNLGAVELTVAIHRVFDTSADRLVFDVGHQCYVHKALTGRQELFSTLRQFGGLSGFPKPYESVHDAFVAGHASNSVSVALGMARARTLQKQTYNVLALIGDGALGGGLSFEGLNDAGASGEPLIVILNDNGMSIDANVGGMSRHLARMRSMPGYYEFKKKYRQVLDGSKAGHKLYELSHDVKRALKKSLLPVSTVFEDMGFAYMGPVDGHDVRSLTDMLRTAREQRRPVLLHVHTVKGRGYAPAEQEPERFHGVPPFDPATGVSAPPSPSFSSVFGEELTALAASDGRICAITAAMTDGTGLSGFAAAHPERFFDVGIAEGHAVAMAAGMAKQGMLPVFAVYDSFLQRGYDMLMQDVSLDGLHVVLAVDRTGLVGADGETHHGCMDYLSQIPGMTVLCPASFAELRHMLRTALYECTGPVAGGGCLHRHLRRTGGPGAGGGGAAGRGAYRGPGGETEPRRAAGYGCGVCRAERHEAPCGAGGSAAAGLHGTASGRRPAGAGRGTGKAAAAERGRDAARTGQRGTAVPRAGTGRRRSLRRRQGGAGMSKKVRLDVLLVERGLLDSRQKAQANIMAGLVFVSGQRVDKPGTAVVEDAPIEVRGHALPYVSRGGLKLEKAMRTFPITLEGRICADIGASTGGFTDCMLQNGAAKVYAVDVGYGQLDWKLRSDPRVVCLERTNARYLDHEQVPDTLDFASIDVSFISLKLIFPALYGLLRQGGEIACLIKPQFEAGREKVGKKGVVRDPKVHLEVLENFLTHAKDNHFTVLGITYSPIRGPEGNIEYLGYLRKSEEQDCIPDLAALVDASHGELKERRDNE